MNPIVNIDLRNHTLYNSADHYSFLRKRFKAELLMVNTNKGSCRCRLFDIDTGELVVGNFDTMLKYIEDQQIVIRVHDNISSL